MKLSNISLPCRGIEGYFIGQRVPKVLLIVQGTHFTHNCEHLARHELSQENFTPNSCNCIHFSYENALRAIHKKYVRVSFKSCHNLLNNQNTLDHIQTNTRPIRWPLFVLGGIQKEANVLV